MVGSWTHKRSSLFVADRWMKYNKQLPLKENWYWRFKSTDKLLLKVDFNCIKKIRCCLLLHIKFWISPLKILFWLMYQICISIHKIALQISSMSHFFVLSVIENFSNIIELVHWTWFGSDSGRRNTSRVAALQEWQNWLPDHHHFTLFNSITQWLD